MINLDAFKDRSPNPMGRLRKSAVLILIMETERCQFLILEKRALSLRSQPGDISLPGGRIEDGETPAEAAVRETCEELGVAAVDIELIGPLDYYVTHGGAIIHPFVARTKEQTFMPNPAEVDRLIFVPLEWLMQEEAEIFSLHIRPKLDEDFPYDRIEGGRNYKFSEAKVDEYFYHFNGHNIWGVTARIIHQFIEILKAGQSI